MGGNGGIWGIVGNCQEYTVGSMEKMCEIGRKQERKAGQFGTNFSFFPVPFSRLFHNLAVFPSSSFVEFCQPNSPTGKLGISGLTDISRFFSQRRWLRLGLACRPLCPANRPSVYHGAPEAPALCGHVRSSEARPCPACGPEASSSAPEERSSACRGCEGGA